MQAGFSILRVGKKFRMVNLGEQFDFEVMRVTTSGKYAVKDLYSLEQYFLDDLLDYGRGKDFSLVEIV